MQRLAPTRRSDRLRPSAALGKTRLRAGVFTLLLVCAATSTLAHAQDWSVRRSAFDQRIVERYKRLLRNNPFDDYALRRLVRLYREHSKLSTLLSETRARAGRNPRDRDEQVVAARISATAGRLDDAIKFAQRASLIGPRQPRLMFYLGQLLLRDDKKAQARAQYEQALSAATKAALKIKILRALIALDLGDRNVKAAREHYQRIVSLAPHDTSLRLEFAQALSSAGDHKQALAEYTSLLKQMRTTEQRADLLKRIGALYHKTGDSKRAVETYRRAMKLTSHNHWLRRELVDRVISIHREKGQLAELIAFYLKQWKRKGAFEHQVLGQLYDETGNEPEATKAYRKALQLEPGKLDVRLRLIALLKRAGLAEEVLSQYRTLTKLAPGEARHQLALARLLHESGRQKEALTVLEHCGRRFPKDASVHSAISDLYGRWGHEKRALREAQLLVRIAPADESHLLSLGERYYLSGKQQKALETWRRLLTAVKPRHRAYAKLAEVYGQHEMVEQAIKLYEKAIAQSPSQLAYHRSLALLLEHSRRTPQALDAWQRTLDKAYEQKDRQITIEARAHTIDLLHRSYKLARYIEAYKRRFADNPHDLAAGFFLAEAQAKRRELAAAIGTYQRILEASKDNIEALSAMEGLYREQRRLQPAIDILKRLAILEPKRARDYYQRIASLELQLNNDPEALKYAHLALTVGTRDAKAFLRLGALYERKEDFAGAKAAYEKAIKLDARLHAARFALARLLTRSGEHQRAEALYREIVAEAKQPETIRRAFRIGIELSEYLGRLELVERVLHPRAMSVGREGPIYRELLVQLYRRLAPRVDRRSRARAN